MNKSPKSNMNNYMGKLAKFKHLHSKYDELSFMYGCSSSTSRIDKLMY